MKNFSVLFFAIFISCSAGAKDIQTQIDFRYSPGYNVSPDGRFAILKLQLSLDKLDKSVRDQLYYIDFAQGISKILIPATQDFDKLDFIFVPDGKRLVLFKQADWRTTDYDEVDVLTLSASGDVVNSETILRREADAKIYSFDFALTKNNDLIYLKKKRNTNELTVYNLDHKTTQVIFQDPELEWDWTRAIDRGPHRGDAPDTNGPGNTEAVAIESKYVFFSKVTCLPQTPCDPDEFYKLSTSDLKFSKLDIPNNDERGMIHEIITDESSNSPWVLVNRCDGPGGMFRTAFNTETSEEVLVQHDPQTICRYSSSDYFKIRGTTIALEDINSDDLVFDLATKKTLAGGIDFFGISDDGTKALVSNSNQFTFFNIPKGDTSAAFAKPPFIQYASLLVPEFNQDSFLIFDGESAAPRREVWRVWHDPSKAPVLFGTFEGNDPSKQLDYPRCVRNDARHSLICLTIEGKLDNYTAAHMVEF